MLLPASVPSAAQKLHTDRMAAKIVSTLDKDCSVHMICENSVRIGFVVCLLCHDLTVFPDLHLIGQDSKDKGR